MDRDGIAEAAVNVFQPPSNHPLPDSDDMYTNPLLSYELPLSDNAETPISTAASAESVPYENIYPRETMTSDHAPRNPGADIKNDPARSVSRRDSPSSSLQPVTTLCDQAESLREEFVKSGDLELLRRAAQCLRQALRLCTHSLDGFRLGILLAFTSTLQVIFRFTADPPVLEECIICLQDSDAILSSLYPSEVCLSRASLGAALREKSKLTGDMELLRRAVLLGEEAVILCPHTHSLRGFVLRECAATLAAAVSRDASTSEDERMEEKAITLLNEAMDLTPIHDPSRFTCASLCANLLVRKATRTADATVFAQSEATFLAGASSLASDDPLLSLVYFDSIGPFSISGSTDVPDSADDEHRIAGTAVGFYLRFIDQLAYLLLVFPPTEMVSLMAQLNSAGSRLTAINVIVGITLNDDQQQLSGVLELMDKGQGMFWTYMLHLRNPIFAEMYPRFSARLRALLYQLDLGLVGRSVNRKAVQDRMNEAICELKTVPGLEHFMDLGSSYTQLRGLTSLGHIVVLVPGERRCHALLITEATLEPIYLPLHDLTAAVISEWITALNPSPSDNAPSSFRGIRVSYRESSLGHVLRQMWYLCVQPIILALGLKPAAGRDRVRLHWCPSGLFARLPLHAATAGRKARCGESCSDYVVSSYTPTLSALLRARKDGDIVDIASNADVRALLIAASHSPGMPPLLGVLEEIQVVEESLNMQHNILGGDDASPSTKQAVMSRLPLSPVVHFACHGVQDTNPLQSGFCLADSRLRILDLMVLNLPHAFLAFLSACETAAVGADWTEEAIHLAGSLLFCGFRSVVATTWSMDDADGPVVARVFYDQLGERARAGGGSHWHVNDVPYALDAAVQTLRSQGVPPERWACFTHYGA